MKDDKNRSRVMYRPGKASGVFGIIWGGIFVLIGVFVAIPTFGAFGILWTLAAVAITGYNAYVAFGKHYVGPEITIEQDGKKEAEGTSAEARLQELRTLYDRRLITPEEYEEKRKEIIDGL